jgi:cell wall-associated NlpC family hydrolase
MKRLALAACLVVAALAAGASARAMPTPDPATADQSGVGSWAEPQIRAVVAHGLMGGSLATFRPNDPVTKADVSDLLAALLHRAATAVPSPDPTPAAPSPSLNMAGLDAQLVRGLGLTAAADQFSSAARAGGLEPPARFGTEVAARLLGLRTNHPASQDDLELLPTDTATRAEAAYSAARLLQLGPSDLQAVKAEASAFELPALTDWESRVLDVSFGFIGFPYIWGGTSESAETPFSVHARGGFDCSGFVWRVYKLQQYTGEGKLADTLRGRTTYSMSGEVPKTKRIAFAALHPADVIFFGDRGPKSTPDQVGHMGIYVGNGWFIHSSEYGVALAQLTGWYRDRFAWARRPLAEAGLERP